MAMRGNAAAIAQLLDGGADEERRPTVGDVVRVVGGVGAGSVATVTVQHTGGELFKLQGASCGSGWYVEAQISVQVMALTAAAAGGHVEAVRLLLERGATADGESGAPALRARRRQQQRPRGGRAAGARAQSAQAGHGRGRSAILPAWHVALPAALSAAWAAEIGQQQQQQQQGSVEEGRRLGEEGRAAAAPAAARAAAVAAVAAAAATSAAAAAQQQQQCAQRQAAAERTARVHTEGAHVERGRRATRHQQRMRQTVHSLATDLGRLSSAGRGAQRERDGLAVQVAALQARLAQVEGSEAAEESASKEAEPAGAVGKQSAANARRRRRRQCAAEQQRGAQQRAAGSGRADGLAGGVNVRLGGLESHVQMQTKAIAEVARVVEAGYNPSVIHNGTIIRKQRAQIKKLEKQVASARQVAAHGTGGHGFCPSANARPGFGSGTVRRDHGWAPDGRHQRRGGGRQRGW